MKNLTELLILELDLETLLENIKDYVGKEQAEMLHEIIRVNQLKEEETRELIKEYIFN